MKIKVMKEVDVPEEYCYRDDNSPDDNCCKAGTESPRDFYCEAFNTTLRTRYIDDEARCLVFVVIPCKQCLKARKRAKNEEI